MQNRKRFSKNLTQQSVLFVFFTVVIVVLLYMRDINGVETNKYIFVGLVSAYALVADYKHLMMLTAFVLPLTNGMPGNYIMPILCLLMAIKGVNKTKVPTVVWVSFFLFSVYELLHFLTFAPTFEASAYVGYCSFLFLLFFIGGSYDSRSDEAMNALSFCLGVVVMLVIILLNFNQLVGDDFFEGSIRMGNVTKYLNEDKMALRTNPNNIGLYSIASISIAFALWYYKKIPFWALAIIAIPSFIGGVYSLSRTWMLSIALFALLFFVMRRGKLRGSSSFILITVAVIAVFYFFTKMNVSVLDSFNARFGGDETAGKRTTYFISYHNWMFETPWALFFGTGALTYKEVTQLFYSTHNAFQQISLAYGIPGLVFFIYLLVSLIKRWRVPGERMVYVPILIIGFFLQSSQFLNPFYCGYPFIASFFVHKMVRKDKIHEKLRKTI